MFHRVFFGILLTTLSLLSTVPSHAALQYSHQELSPDFVGQARSYYPEGQLISPTLLDLKVDPNLRLFQEAGIHLTYIEGQTNYRNSFGYFLFQDLNDDKLVTPNEILHREIIFENASQEGEGGELRPGDSVFLGKFPAGTRMGFYLIANGFIDPFDTFYTRDELNPDGKRHIAMAATPNYEEIILGIEDLPWEQSDRDFNDLLFFVTTDPKSALREIIEDGHLPVPGVSPSPQIAESAPYLPQTHVETLDTSTIPTPPAYLEGSRFGCQLIRHNKTAHQGTSLLLIGSLMMLHLAIKRFRSRA